MSDKHYNVDNIPVVSCVEDEACQQQSCELCLVDLPNLISITAEGEDYIHHFCGLDCLAKWKEKQHPIDSTP